MPGIADKFTQSAQGRLLWPGMTVWVPPVFPSAEQNALITRTTVTVAADAKSLPHQTEIFARKPRGTTACGKATWGSNAKYISGL
jgi:hypothetical protein